MKLRGVEYEKTHDQYIDHAIGCSTCHGSESFCPTGRTLHDAAMRILNRYPTVEERLAVIEEVDGRRQATFAKRLDEAARRDRCGK